MAGFFAEYATVKRPVGRPKKWPEIADAISRYLRKHGRQRYEEFVGRVCRRFAVSEPTAKLAIKNGADLSRWGWVYPKRNA